MGRHWETRLSSPQPDPDQPDYLTTRQDRQIRQVSTEGRTGHVRCRQGASPPRCPDYMMAEWSRRSGALHRRDGVGSIVEHDQLASDVGGVKLAVDGKDA